MECSIRRSAKIIWRYWSEVKLDIPRFPMNPRWISGERKERKKEKKLGDESSRFVYNIFWVLWWTYKHCLTIFGELQIKPCRPVQRGRFLRCQNGVFLLLRAFIIALGGKGVNCSFLSDDVWCDTITLCWHTLFLCWWFRRAHVRCAFVESRTFYPSVEAKRTLEVAVCRFSGKEDLRVEPARNACRSDDGLKLFLEVSN